MLLAKLLALAIIAAHEAQSIQSRIAKTRPYLRGLQGSPAAERARSADVRVIDSEYGRVG